MKLKEFKSFIREEIIATLSEGEALTFIASTGTSEEDSIKKNPKIPSDAKTGALNTLKSLKPGSAIAVPTNEMARAKVSYALNIDKAQELKDIIEKAKGNVKKALEYLLDKGEMSVADVAKEFGLSDTASINNPKFRELMGMLKDKGVVSMGGAAPKPAAAKPSKEKVEKAVKAVEKITKTNQWS